MKKKRKMRFWQGYLLFVAVLALAVTGAAFYVRSVLQDYEETQPTHCVEDALAQLTGEATAGTLWDQYGLPAAQPGRFEAGQDLRAAYTALLTDSDTVYRKKAERRSDGRVCYEVEKDGFVLAEIELCPDGAPETRLGILTRQAWALEAVRPVFAARDYTLTLPAGFTASVNGTPLTESDGTPNATGGMDYTVPGLYLRPQVAIASPDGAQVAYAIRENRIVPEIFHYNLTLPAALTVSVNGTPHEGTPLEDGFVCHDIAMLQKPQVTVSDRFGTTLTFDGQSELPLTWMTIRADSRYTVQAAGQAVQPDATRAVPDYDPFAEFVPDLPEIATYNIAVLQNDAPVTVADRAGTPVTLAPGLHEYDLTQYTAGTDEIPAEIADAVDVLDVAQKWSLFMSADLKFSELAPYLLRNSYQYDMAYKYSRSIDITFTSIHDLMDPPFTDISVKNFVWIADNCFSVDISFVKHMRLDRGGMKVDDPMHDRFYFVLYDDSDDGADNAAWKLAGIKEIV